MAIEYLGLSEINGPLVAVEGIRGAFYDEIVELVVEEKQKKLGRIVEINNDYAVVQVFESTEEMSLLNTHARLTGRPLCVGLSEEILGRTFNGLGQPIDGLGAVHGYPPGRNTAATGGGTRDCGGAPRRSARGGRRHNASPFVQARGAARRAGRCFADGADRLRFRRNARCAFRFVFSNAQMGHIRRQRDAAITKEENPYAIRRDARKRRNDAFTLALTGGQRAAVGHQAGDEEPRRARGRRSGIERRAGAGRTADSRLLAEGSRRLAGTEQARPADCF